MSEKTNASEGHIVPILAGPRPFSRPLSAQSAHCRFCAAKRQVLYFKSGTKLWSSVRNQKWKRRSPQQGYNRSNSTTGRNQKSFGTYGRSINHRRKTRSDKSGSKRSWTKNYKSRSQWLRSKTKRVITSYGRRNKYNRREFRTKGDDSFNQLLRSLVGGRTQHDKTNGSSDRRDLSRRKVLRRTWGHL